MGVLSRDGLSAEQLAELLTKHGDSFDDYKRRDMVRELMGMQAAENMSPPIGAGLPSQYDPAMGRISQCVLGTHDFNTESAALHANTLAGWADEYIQGMDAAKMVLEFLQAQSGMDLFQSNAKAKRLYERIVTAGVEEVLYNNRRWSR